MSHSSGRSAWVVGLGLVLAGLAAFWLVRDEPRTAAVLAPASTSSTPGPTRTAEDEADGERAPEGARRPAELEPAGARELVLVLERFPDRAPVAHVLVEVEPRADEGEAPWLTSADDGRVSVRVPAAARALRVRAAGFEPGEAALARDARELRLVLTPSAGLFGRVLRPDGTPAAAARVHLTLASWTVQLLLDERYPRPQSYAREEANLVASATTNADGWYFLDWPTRTARASAEVRAELGELAGMLAAALPREPAPLPELVLAPPATVLVVRVVDADGRPLPDALVRGQGSPLPSGEDRTDTRGELVLASPRLPATFFAYAPGYQARECRHDGRVVTPWTPVEPQTGRVEIVLAPAAGARVRILDAETRFPLFLAHCRCELVAGDEVVGRSDFEPDRDGLAWVSFQDTYQTRDPPVAPESARLSIDKEGYEEDQLFELDARTPSGPEPIELALRPLPGWAMLRGRVVRAGEPLPRFQVGMKAQPYGADPSREGWQYGRAYTDAEGRFALRWRRDATARAVTLFPHWTSWDEFAFLGPMSEDEAMAGELVLELHPAVRVPAVVRGVVRGGSYRYYVSLLGGDEPQPLVVPTTINGVPLTADADGELRTLLRLPGERRVQVTIGYAGEGRSHPDGCAPVVYDPAHPRLPLEFELQPLFLRVRGRVTGFAPAELASVGIALASAEEADSSRSAALTRLESDGSFELQASRGNKDLFLVETSPGKWRTILARQRVVLERDVEGLVLAPDPAAEVPR